MTTYEKHYLSELIKAIARVRDNLADNCITLWLPELNRIEICRKGIYLITYKCVYRKLKPKELIDYIPAWSQGYEKLQSLAELNW